MTKYSSLLLLASTILPVTGFQISPRSSVVVGLSHRHSSSQLFAEEWKGDVVSNTDDGRIKGCVITSVGETEFTVQIDG